VVERIWKLMVDLDLGQKNAVIARVVDLEATHEQSP
jgi:hypothetical protein